MLANNPQAAAVGAALTFSLTCNSYTLKLLTHLIVKSWHIVYADDVAKSSNDASDARSCEHACHHAATTNAADDEWR